MGFLALALPPHTYLFNHVAHRHVSRRHAPRSPSALFPQGLAQDPREGVGNKRVPTRPERFVPHGRWCDRHRPRSHRPTECCARAGAPTNAREGACREPERAYPRGCGESVVGFCGKTCESLIVYQHEIHARRSLDLHIEAEHGKRLFLPRRMSGYCLHWDVVLQGPSQRFVLACTDAQICLFR